MASLVYDPKTMCWVNPETRKPVDDGSKEYRTARRKNRRPRREAAPADDAAQFASVEAFMLETLKEVKLW